MESQENVGKPEAEIHIMGSVLARAQQVCAEEGATLNEFVNVAVAEKLAHHAHMRWVQQKMSVTPDDIKRVRMLFRKGDSPSPDPGDELPEGYVWPYDLP